MTMDRELVRPQLEAAAVHATAYRYRRWGFGEGPALLGLLAAAEVLDRPDLTAAVERVAGPTLDRPARPEDHLIPVEALVALARQRRGLDVSAAVGRFERAVLDAARPVAGRPPVHRPDHPELGSTIWVDCLHTDGPGLAVAGHAGVAAELVEEVAAILQDGTGLFSHGYDVAAGVANGVHWSRGQGWALHGLVGLAKLASPEHRPSLVRRTETLLTALDRHEIDGGWRIVVDDGRSPLENSLSPMVAAAVLTGVADGVVDPGWLELADRCLRYTLDHLDGGALAVSAATPVGPVASYRQHTLGVFPWGQGPVLLALCAAIGHTDPVGTRFEESSR